MPLPSNPSSKQHKVTAAEVAKPPVDNTAAKDVALLGSEIRAHLKFMRGYEAEARKKADVPLRKAQNHYDTITQLLAQAKAKCDRAGFRKFRAKYCPDLGRSRMYELLAIAGGRKTLEEIRAEKRASVAKSRSRKRVSTTDDDVADKPEVEPPHFFVDFDFDEGGVQHSTAAPAKSAGVELADLEVTTEPEALPPRSNLPAPIEVVSIEPVGAEFDDDTLGCVIRREWLALEALTSHTVAQVAQAIDPDIALLQEISGFIAALIAAKLAARSAGNGEQPDVANALFSTPTNTVAAPAAGSEYSTPEDGGIPRFLQRGAA